MQVTGGEITEADPARQRQVDVSPIIGNRRTAKGAARSAFFGAPGRPTKGRVWRLEAARAATDRLTETVKALAIELARCGPAEERSAG